MRLVIAVLIVLLICLQMTLWAGPGGVRDVRKLEQAVAEREAEIAALKERNRALYAEVVDLKEGLEAVEELARSEMGMVREGEQFFRIIDEPTVSAAPNDLETGGGQ